MTIAEPIAAAGLPAGAIVHVSADFPDSIQPAKTRAIETLVRLVDDRFDQQVISLNRTGSVPDWVRKCLAHPLRPRLAVRTGERGDRVLPLSYDAPPRGFHHATLLEQLGDWLAERLAAGPRPALLVGHKLAVEGIAVRRAAGLLGVPFALSIQGDTDLKILGARPDLRPLLRRCFHEAAVVFPFAPWALSRVEALLGARAGQSVVVPCPVASDALHAPRSGGDGLASAFHLQNWRRKNLAAMAVASDEVARAVPGAVLAVIGGGSPRDVAACARIAARHPAVVLEGPQPLAAMPTRLNRASGFVLPSRRESFGLVFVESLFAGLPIVYPAGWAVDGLLDGETFAIRVDHASPPSIAEGMIRLLREEDVLKRALARWQAGPGPARFRRETIAAAFAGGLAGAIASGARVA